MITTDELHSKIFTIRGVQVMIDRDLAELYGVQTKVLNQAVKRNKSRFPDVFCFKFNKDEFMNWKSQFVTSNSEKMGLRHLPYAFTEQGVAMLSTVMMLSKRNQQCEAIIYTQKINAQLKLDLAKHNEQYPLIEVKELKNVHDRFLIIDKKELYHIGASLKDLGRKWFAFSKLDEFLPDVLERLR
jgi:hypothetical protein